MTQLSAPTALLRAIRAEWVLFAVRLRRAAATPAAAAATAAAATAAATLGLERDVDPILGAVDHAGLVLVARRLHLHGLRLARLDLHDLRRLAELLAVDI